MLSEVQQGGKAGSDFFHFQLTCSRGKMHVGIVLSLGGKIAFFLHTSKNLFHHGENSTT